MKFIKMKYHEAYLLYYSVLFVVIVILIYSDEKMFGELKSEIKNLRKVRVCTFLRLKLLISAGKN